MKFHGRYLNLIQDFIDENESDNKVWARLSRNIVCPPENFIDKYRNKIYWISLDYSSCNDDIVRKYKEFVDWRNFSLYQNLSEKFIEEFQDRVHWTAVSAKHNLSIDFIRKFEDKLFWPYLFFGNENKDKLKLEFKNRFCLFERCMQGDLIHEVPREIP